MKLFNKLFGKDKNCNVISFKTAMDLTNVPVITFRQNGKRINFIFDTGSSHSAIDKKALKDLKYEMVEGMQATSLGVDGAHDGYGVCQLDFELDGYMYTQMCSVLDLSGPFSTIKKKDGVTVHGLLGNDFFTNYQYVLDFDKLIAYSKYVNS